MMDNNSEEQNQQQPRGAPSNSNSNGNRNKNNTAVNTTDQLSHQYIPTPWDVICQRGRECYDHVGNRRFKMCIDNHLEAYILAHTRPKKTVVVVAIVKTIYDNAAHVGGHGFIRKDPISGSWYAVSDKIVKEKVGQALRDSVKYARKHNKMTSTFAIAERSLLLNPTKPRRYPARMPQRATTCGQVATTKSQSELDEESQASIDLEVVDDATKSSAAPSSSLVSAGQDVPPPVAAVVEAAATQHSNNRHPSIPHQRFEYGSEELEPLDASDPSIYAGLNEGMVRSSKQTNEFVRATEALIQQLAMDDRETDDSLQRKPPPVCNDGHLEQSNLAYADMAMPDCAIAHSLTNSKSISGVSSDRVTTGHKTVATSHTKDRASIQDLDFLNDNGGDGESGFSLIQSLPASTTGAASSMSRWEDHLDQLDNIEFI